MFSENSPKEICFERLFLEGEKKDVEQKTYKVSGVLDWSWKDVSLFAPLLGSPGREEATLLMVSSCSNRGANLTVLTKVVEK